MKKVEINSFVGYVGSYVFFGLLLFWVITPESVLHKIGITSYPDRSWGLALLAMIPILVLYIQILYQGLNMYNTKPIDSLYSIEDSYSRSRPPEELKPGNLPGAFDIPLPVVSKLLYYKEE